MRVPLWSIQQRTGVGRSLGQAVLVALLVGHQDQDVGLAARCGCAPLGQRALPSPATPAAAASRPRLRGSPRRSVVDSALMSAPALTAPVEGARRSTHARRRRPVRAARRRRGARRRRPEPSRTTSPAPPSATRRWPLRRPGDGAREPAGVVAAELPERDVDLADVLGVAAAVGDEQAPAVGRDRDAVRAATASCSRALARGPSAGRRATTRSSAVERDPGDRSPR